MIIEFIIGIVIGFLKLVFGLLPNLPPTPDIVVSTQEWIFNIISVPINVLRYLYTPILFNAILVLLVAVLFFEQIYHSVMWILKKIGVLNIH